MGPSTALVPLDPLSPQPTAAPAHPLGRSGIDLLDILATTDAVATRGPTGAVALEVGLEHARGALLRNLPGDALAALDGVWERARKTGWCPGRLQEAPVGLATGVAIPQCRR